MYVEFLLLSFFITDESFERPLLTPFRSMMMKRDDDVRCVFRASNEFFWRLSCLAKKKFITKAIFCSSVVLWEFLRDTKATLTTTIKKEEKTEMMMPFYFWSEDEKSAEKAFDDERGERCFVGFAREVRRYNFHTHSSEIESRLNRGCEILVRGEYGDEKVGEEIVSRGWFEKEV